MLCVYVCPFIFLFFFIFNPFLYRMLMGVVGGCVYDKDTLQVNKEVGITHTSMVGNNAIIIVII